MRFRVSRPPAARIGAVGSLIAALVLGLAGCQSQGTATRIATDGSDAGFVSWLAKPEGDGPFPAVVLLHGCSGLERDTPHRTVWRGIGRHAALLNDNGYVTLIVDSFGPRGIADGCRTGGKYYPVQVGDARAAFDHLAALPFVDGARIGLVAFSLGGGTALFMAANVGQGTEGYAAHVAYYPYCNMMYIDHPVLILIGAEDDWTPAHLCRYLHQMNADRPVELTVYPDAHHSFDMPIPQMVVFEGHKVAQNVDARRDSQARMLAFLGRHLGAAR